jgi:hypothetical protein
MLPITFPICALRRDHLVTSARSEQPTSTSTILVRLSAVLSKRRLTMDSLVVPNVLDGLFK